MANLPWFKLWAADFLSDNYVDAMTAEQIGWYCILLIRSWNSTPKGYLANDKQLLSKWCKDADPLSFERRAQIVLDRFQVTEDGQYIYHPRIIEQVDHGTQLSEKRRVAGRRGIEKRQMITLSNCQANAKQLPTDSDSDSDNNKHEFSPLDCAIGFCTDHGYTGTGIRRDAEQAIELRSRLRKITPQEATRQISEEWENYERTTTSYKKGISRWLSECNQAAQKKRPLGPGMVEELKREMGELQ